MSYNNKEPDFAPLISLLTHLVCCCKTKSEQIPEGGIPTLIANTNFDIPSECENMVSSFNFYFKLFREVSSYMEGFFFFLILFYFILFFIFEIF